VRKPCGTTWFACGSLHIFPSMLALNLVQLPWLWLPMQCRGEHPWRTRLAGLQIAVPGMMRLKSSRENLISGAI
jgi:hypothetical protein